MGQSRGMDPRATHEPGDLSAFAFQDKPPQGLTHGITTWWSGTIHHNVKKRLNSDSNADRWWLLFEVRPSFIPAARRLGSHFPRTGPLLVCPKVMLHGTIRNEQCRNAVLRWKSSLRIASCNVNFSRSYYRILILTRSPARTLSY